MTRVKRDARLRARTVDDALQMAWSSTNEPGEGIWVDGDAYESYVGRWSRLAAREFVDWLAAPAGARWLDVGCGTGALTQTILEHAAPIDVAGVDPSSVFICHAESHIPDFRVHLQVAEAQLLPFEDSHFDVVVSGLALNCMPEPELCISEMSRVSRAGGTIAAYVWDFADMMQMTRIFWDAAGTLDPAALDLDEGHRFPLCRAGALRLLFSGAGLSDVTVRPIDACAVFHDFDDYWQPFLCGQGPAQNYALSLSEGERLDLRELIRRTLPTRQDGSIDLIARAWAVRGRAS